MQELQTSISRKLNDNWNMYYHLPDDKQWDLESYKYVASNINTLEEIISINEKIPEKIVKHCMLFVMRKGITPMWEDKKNRLGGCFSYKVVNKLVFDVWKILCYSLCGETLCKDVSKSHLINGITISPKKNFCIIKIWLSDCSMQDPDVLIPIENLSKQGCLFKKHNPEF
tara:strand:- start:131 stop:640 length:510 start_codon:yes stop_codon:yes gene_type:complete